MTQLERVEMDHICGGLETKSDKIRALAAAGVTKADIGRYLGVRYQFVYNVLKAAPSLDRKTEEEGAEYKTRANDETGEGLLTIPEAKRRLARAFGVPESAIKITIEH